MRHLFVPMYETLSVRYILDVADAHAEVLEYLPDQKDVPRLPRQWIINVLFTILGGDFADWVDQHVKARNTGRLEEKQQLIELDPAIARAFQQSTHVSTR